MIRQIYFTTLAVSARAATGWLVGWFGQIYLSILTNIFGNLNKYILQFDKYILQFWQIYLAIWTNTFCDSGCECESCNRMVGWQLSATRGRRWNKNHLFLQNDRNIYLTKNIWWIIFATRGCRWNKNHLFLQSDKNEYLKIFFFDQWPLPQFAANGIKHYISARIDIVM